MTAGLVPDASKVCHKDIFYDKEGVVYGSHRELTIYMNGLLDNLDISSNGLSSKTYMKKDFTRLTYRNYIFVDIQSIIGMMSTIIDVAETDP